MESIVICTVNAKCLPVLATSIRCYVPTNVPVYLSGNVPYRFDFGARPVHVMENAATNFGDAYNAAMQEAFKHHQSVILANDDICLTPTSYDLLRHDLETLEGAGHKVGLLGCRSDYVLWPQNIRSTIPNDKQAGLKWESEGAILETDVIAPIWAYVSKEAFEKAQIPPINWYSDNVWCYDLAQHGYKHWISRSYVHHAGSQTVSMDHAKNHREAAPWVQLNRPELAKILFG